MAVVETIQIGKCKIVIHDDAYKDKTPEEIQKCCDEASRYILDFYRRKACLLQSTAASQGRT